MTGVCITGHNSDGIQKSDIEKENKQLRASWMKHRRQIKQLRQTENDLKLVLEFFIKESANSHLRWQRKVDKTQQVISRLRNDEQNSTDALRQTEQRLEESKREIVQLRADVVEREAQLQNARQEKEVVLNELENVKKDLEDSVAHEKNEREIFQLEISSLLAELSNLTVKLKDVMSQKHSLEETIKESDVDRFRLETKLESEIERLGRALEVAEEETWLAKEACEKVSQELISWQMRSEDLEEQLMIKQALIDDGLQREEILIAKSILDQEVIVDLTTTVDNLENKLLPTMKRGDDFKAEIEVKDAIFTELQTAMKKLEAENAAAVSLAAAAEELVQKARNETKSERKRALQLEEELHTQNTLRHKIRTRLEDQLDNVTLQLTHLAEETKEIRTNLGTEYTKIIVQFTEELHEAGTSPVRRTAQRVHQINETYLKANKDIQSLFENAQKGMTNFVEKLEAILG